MRTPRTLQELDDLILEGDIDGRHNDLAEHCAGLAARATAHDAVSKGELLVAAGEQYRLAGDPARSVSLCRQAVADGGPVRLDARAHLVAALIGVGETQEARSVVEAIWADRPRDLQLLLFVGEQLEMMDDLNAAVTWFTKGVVCPIGRDDSFGKVLLLFARARVRDKMGFPPDEFDLLAEDIREEYAHRQLVGGQSVSAPPQRWRGPCPCGSGRKSKRCCGADRAYTAVVTEEEDQVVIDLVGH